MARELLIRSRMNALGLALAFVAASTLSVHAQQVEPPDGTRITTAQVSGIDLDRLSPGLREDIGKLAGTPLNRQQLKDLAARIEAELPRLVAGVRIIQDPAGGARVDFVVARVRQEGGDPNINARYTVERVVIQGVSEDAISQQLRNDIDAMVGKPFDSEATERLGDRLSAELPKYDVSRQTSRGSRPGVVKLTYVLSRSESSRWLRFEPYSGHALYHSDQGWGANLPLAMDNRVFRVMPTVAIDVGDDLVEEYTGFGIRVESRQVGTDRLGLVFDWATYDSKWRNQTTDALLLRPDVPGAYGSRMHVTPLIKFAITRQLGVAAGVDVVELDSLNDGGPSQMANAATGSIRFDQRWTSASGRRQYLNAAMSMRAGARSLESDYSYERYSGHVDYAYAWGKQTVLVSGLAGGISGTAPLFDRFTLGDSRTLRGWDKYAIAPVGGDRVFSASLEYRYGALMAFFDAGSVWDTGTARRVRTSAGVGVTSGTLFAIVGFPLNTDDFRAVFTAGIRFGLGLGEAKKF